jgi:hypothetical protein
MRSLFTWFRAVNAMAMNQMRKSYLAAKNLANQSGWGWNGK